MVNIFTSFSVLLVGWLTLSNAQPRLQGHSNGGGIANPQQPIQGPSINRGPPNGVAGLDRHLGGLLGNRGLRVCKVTNSQTSVVQCDKSSNCGIGYTCTENNMPWFPAWFTTFVRKISSCQPVACTDASTCGGTNYVCETRWHWGAKECRMPCTDNSQCTTNAGTGYECVGRQNHKYCQPKRTCTTNADCPTGYECRNMNGRMSCALC